MIDLSEKTLTTDLSKKTLMIDLSNNSNRVAKLAISQLTELQGS